MLRVVVVVVRRRRRTDETEPPPPSYSPPPPFPNNNNPSSGSSSMSHGSFNETSFSFSNFFRWQHQAGGEEEEDSEEEGDDDNPNHHPLLEQYEATLLVVPLQWLAPDAPPLAIAADCGRVVARGLVLGVSSLSKRHRQQRGAHGRAGLALLGGRRGLWAGLSMTDVATAIRIIHRWCWCWKRQLSTTRRWNGEPADYLVKNALQMNASSLTHNGTAAYQQARNFSLGLRPYLLQRDPCWTAASESNSKNDSSAACDDDGLFLRVTSYYSVVEEQDLPPWIARGSWAVGSSVVLLEIEYTFDANQNNKQQQLATPSPP